MPIKIQVCVMTFGNKCAHILTEKHFYLIHAELWKIVVSFAQIKCWTDTKLETVWNSLIVYNMLCACSVLREGARCIPDRWENSNIDDLRVKSSYTNWIIHFYLFIIFPRSDAFDNLQGTLHRYVTLHWKTPPLHTVYTTPISVTSLHSLIITS